MLKRRQDQSGGDLGSSDFVLLPAIDLRGGRVVRLQEGDFGRETAYDLDPVAVARDFKAAGARWIHIVDLDGAREGARRQNDVVAEIVATVGERVACEVAGGFRDEESVAAAIDAGAARVVVGTAALRDPGFVTRLVHAQTPDRVAVALDVRDGLAVGQGWVPGASGVPMELAMRTLAEHGATTFIVTSIARDGLLAGPDLPLLGRLVGLGLGDVIASGGVSSVDDIVAVRRLGCAGAIVGRALYEGRLRLGDAIAALGAGS